MPNEKSPSVEEQQAALISELRHRTRGTLATMRLIVRRSAEASDSIEDYVAHLDGRLGALARVQNAASRSPFEGIDLDLLVRDELASLEKDDRIEVDGPHFLLQPRAAEPFALIIHELLTNAMKFGALSIAGGRLAIGWHIVERDDQANDLQFDWIETGVSLLETKPARKGFGMIVLQEMAEYNLGAQTVVTFARGGLTCRITLPISTRITAC